MRGKNNVPFGEGVHFMRNRLSIAWKLIIIYLIVTIPLVIVIALTYSAWYRAELGGVVTDRIELARLTGISFDEIIADIDHTMRAIGRRITGDNLSQQRSDEALRQLVLDYPLDNAVFLNPAGKVIATTNPSLIGQDLSHDQAVVQVLKDKDVRGIEPSERSPTGAVGFHVARSIRRNGTLLGAVASFVDVTRLHNTLPVRIGAGGANVVDSNGHVVFQSEFPQLAPAQTFWGNIPVIKSALAGSESTSTDAVFPPSNPIRVGAEVPIPDIKWASGSFVDFTIAIGPVRQNITIAAIATIVIALIALFFSVRFARGIVNSLQSLVGKARRVGEGDFAQPILVQTGDEVEDVAQSLDETRKNLKRYVEGLSGIAEAGRLLTASLEMEEVKTTVIKTLERLFGAMAVWIFVFNEKTQRLEVMFWSGPGAKEFSKVTLEPGESLAGQVFKTGRPSIVLDVQTEPTFVNKEVAGEYGLKSAVQLPLAVGQEPFGVLGMFLPEATAASLGERETEILNIFASQVAPALENASLFKEIVE
ncbi:MAG: GAF domain-containing protein, partial [Chloroflexi bacterium]|nr:GAF domain-containing protein [Chloroflexota bacterium]